MAIRIKPKDIKIPKGDPFKNDGLEREESICVLTSLIAFAERFSEPFQIDNARKQ